MDEIKAGETLSTTLMSGGRAFVRHLDGAGNLIYEGVERMDEKVFALTEADRAKLENALLESQKALEGVPGALADVRRRAFREAAAMAEEEAGKIAGEAEDAFSESTQYELECAASRMTAFAKRLRAAAEAE